MSQHKADIAFQKRAQAEAGVTPASDGTATPAPRQPAALRFRGGSRSSTRPSEVAMVGVVDFGEPKAAAVPVVSEPAPTPTPEGADAADGKAAKSRRGKRGGVKHKKAAAPPAEKAIEKVAAAPKAVKVSKPRTSKPRAG